MTSANFVERIAPLLRHDRDRGSHLGPVVQRFGIFHTQHDTTVGHSLPQVAVPHRYPRVAHGRHGVEAIFQRSGVVNTQPKGHIQIPGAGIGHGILL